MNKRKLTYFFSSMIFFSSLTPLISQPFGYPYDPYSDDLPPLSSPYVKPQEMEPSPGFPQRTSLPPSAKYLNQPRPLLSEPLSQKSSSTFGQREEDFDQEKIAEILDFWFGPLRSASSFPINKVALWEGDKQLNDQLKKRFFQDYQKGAQGEYLSWRKTPKGLLALILLLDIFPRHFFPGDAKMFATDKIALALAQEGIQNGQDLELFPVERLFFYMPFQHSEDVKMQLLSVKLYQELAKQSPEEIRPLIHEFFVLAVKHQETIENFGRFPHRNLPLKRESTIKENQYLQKQSALRY